MNNLFYLRSFLNFRLSDMAKIIGTNSYLYYAYETNRISCPIDCIMLFSYVFDIKVYDLIFMEGDRFVKKYLLYDAEYILKNYSSAKSKLNNFNIKTIKKEREKLSKKVSNNISFFRYKKPNSITYISNELGIKIENYISKEKCNMFTIEELIIISNCLNISIEKIIQ